MARLFLLFIAGMILAAHASLIPGVSQFLKLDYLTKLLKLYACFYELKELCYNTFFCFLISDIDFYRLTTSVINTTDEDTHFNPIYYTCVFRRPIHSRYPKICTRVSKLMPTRNPRPFLWVARRRAKRKEIVSTTLTRSVTNIKDQASQTHLNLEYLICFDKELNSFFYAIQIFRKFIGECLFLVAVLKVVIFAGC